MINCQLPPQIFQVARKIAKVSTLDKLKLKRWKQRDCKASLSYLSKSISSIFVKSNSSNVCQKAFLPNLSKSSNICQHSFLQYHCFFWTNINVLRCHFSFGPIWCSTDFSMCTFCTICANFVQFVQILHNVSKILHKVHFEYFFTICAINQVGAVQFMHQMFEVMICWDPAARVARAIYVTDLFRTNFQDFFKYFLVFVLIFVLVFVSVFLEDGAARAGCHICHWLVPHSSATNVFAFSFTWTSLHLFKFYIHAISIHWCNPHVNVCPAAAQIQMNSSRIWICPQIKTMRALSLSILSICFDICFSISFDMF